MSSLPVLMISMTIWNSGVEMTGGPADSAQKRDGAETNADVTMWHAPKFGVRPRSGEIVECFGRNEKIAHAFHDEDTLEIRFLIVEIKDVEVDGRDGHALTCRFREGKRGHGDIHARDRIHENGELERLRMRGKQTREPAAE